MSSLFLLFPLPRDPEADPLPQVFLAAMDNTIVVSSYGAIGSDLKELNRTSWIATAYVPHPPFWNNMYPCVDISTADISSQRQVSSHCMGN